MSQDNTQYLSSDVVKLILARFDSVDARFETIDNRLTALEEKVDRRLQETRPIWEQVLARLDGLDTRMGSLDIRMDSLETEMRSGFHKLGRQIGELARDVLIVRADQRDLEKRMDKLESERAG